MPSSTSLAKDDKPNIRQLEQYGNTSTAKDDKPQLSQLERIQPGGILGATLQTGLVPFGLERDEDGEPA